MSKALYLIGLNGSFLQWCPGCLVRIERNDQIVARNPHGFRIELCAAPRPSFSKAPGDQFGEAGFMAAQEKAHSDYARAVRGCIAAWQQAIITAPDGALLRWDSDRQQVVDELAEDGAAFAEHHLLDTQSGPIERAEIDLRENEVADDVCVACGGNGLDIPYAAGCGRCGA
jgi:hypothetical protein